MPASRPQLDPRNAPALAPAPPLYWVWCARKTRAWLRAVGIWDTLPPQLQDYLWILLCHTRPRDGRGDTYQATIRTILGCSKRTAYLRERALQDRGFLSLHQWREGPRRHRRGWWLHRRLAVLHRSPHTSRRLRQRLLEWLRLCCPNGQAALTVSGVAIPSRHPPYRVGEGSAPSGTAAPRPIQALPPASGPQQPTGGAPGPVQGLRPPPAVGPPGPPWTGPTPPVESHSAGRLAEERQGEGGHDCPICAAWSLVTAGTVTRCRRHGGAPLRHRLRGRPC